MCIVFSENIILKGKNYLVWYMGNKFLVLNLIVIYKNVLFNWCL